MTYNMIMGKIHMHNMALYIMDARLTPNEFTMIGDAQQLFFELPYFEDEEECDDDCEYDEGKFTIEGSDTECCL